MRIELYLKHGRNSPHEDLYDWGFDGPRLQNVIGLHQTYGYPCNVVFATDQDAKVAQELTGWRNFDTNSLSMSWLGDLVTANSKFYGDWGLWMGEE